MAVSTDNAPVSWTCAAPLHFLWGRQREQAELNQMLLDVRSGRSRVLVVRGEAGIGKTALLEYLAGRHGGVSGGARRRESSRRWSSRTLGCISSAAACWAALRAAAGSTARGARGRVRPARGRGSGSVHGWACGARPRFRRPPTMQPQVCLGRRRSMVGSGFGADAGVRGTSAAGRARRAGVRGARRRRRRDPRRASRADRARSAGRGRPSAAWMRRSQGPWTSGSAIGSWRRRVAIRLR